MNNKKAGWTKTKWTSRTITGEELSKLRATHDVNIGAYGRVFIRKRNRQIPMARLPMIQVNDQRKMLTRMQPVRLTNWKRMTKWLRKLLVITITVLIATSVVYFDTDHYLSPLDGDKAVKLIPCHACKFTEQELEDFENKFKLQAVEAKKEEVKVNAPEEVEAVVRKYFGDIANEALTCFKSESGLRPHAVNYSNRNGTWDIGLAQVNTIHCGKVNATDRNDCKAKLLDLDTNVRVAKQIYDGRGWNAWYGKACKPMWK